MFLATLASSNYEFLFLLNVLVPFFKACRFLQPEPVVVVSTFNLSLKLFRRFVPSQGVSEDLGIHHIVVNDWDRGVDADQNVVLLSVPSVLSPDLAPPGKHVLHAYTPGTEPYELWEGLDHSSAEYKKLKVERSEVFLLGSAPCQVTLV